MAVKFLLFSEILHLVVALLTLRRHDDGAVVAFQLVSNGNPRSAKSKSSVVTSRSKSSLNAVSSRRDVLTTASTAGMILVAGVMVPLDADNGNKALAYLMLNKKLCTLTI